jgi:hydrogenase expression/formation protein HypD
VADGRAVVETQYTRSVSEQGNLAAQHLVDQVFVPCDASWRGLGTIVGSGLAIRPEYRAFDAAHRPGVTMGVARTNPACRCGDILRGLVVPTECRCFAKACTPLNPLGPCMVSSEGTCAAYYKYERRVAA